MASRAVAAQEEAQVPALVRTPALEIESGDIVLPRLYIGQFTSDAVKAQLVKPGAIYSAAGSDDGDPVTLAEPTGKSGVAAEDGIYVYILGMRKAKSHSPKPGELNLYSFNDPSAPEDAWTTYNYMVALPDFDTDVPYKWLLSRTGAPTARKINTVLKKYEARGPAWSTAFRFSTDPRHNDKGDWFIAQVTAVEAKPEHTEAVASLAAIVAEVPSDPISPRSQEPPI